VSKRHQCWVISIGTWKEEHVLHKFVLSKRPPLPQPPSLIFLHHNIFAAFMS